MFDSSSPQRPGGGRTLGTQQLLRWLALLLDRETLSLDQLGIEVLLQALCRLHPDAPFAQEASGGDVSVVLRGAKGPQAALGPSALFASSPVLDLLREPLHSGPAAAMAEHSMHRSTPCADALQLVSLSAEATLLPFLDKDESALATVLRGLYRHYILEHAHKFARGGPAAPAEVRRKASSSSLTVTPLTPSLVVVVT